MGQPQMLHVQTSRGVTVVTGEVDLASAAELDDQLAGVQDPLVLDLRGVGFMDSSGIRVLLHQRQHRASTSSVRVVGMSRSVQRVLQVTGLLGLFSDASTPTERYAPSPLGAGPGGVTPT